MFLRDKNDSSLINLPAKLILILAGIVVGFLFCRIFITPYKVADSSMEPHLEKGSRVLILKVGKIRPGDIVLAENPLDRDTVIMKRVVATDGNVVELRNKILYIDNQRASFDWMIKPTDPRVFPLHFSSRDTMTPVKLSRDQYFLMGDNSDRSNDSRELGPFPKKDIIGKIIYIF
jgi:signal peptidase I